MVIHFGNHFWDFKNMYTWADFDLRMNHASIQRNPHPKYIRPKHIKPNLRLIAFWEIRYIRGDLKMWLEKDDAWVSAYNQAPELQSELNRLYADYLFETKVLEIK